MANPEVTVCVAKTARRSQLQISCSRCGHHVTMAIMVLLSTVCMARGFTVPSHLSADYQRFFNLQPAQQVPKPGSHANSVHQLEALLARVNSGWSTGSTLSPQTSSTSATPSASPPPPSYRPDQDSESDGLSGSISANRRRRPRVEVKHKYCMRRSKIVTVGFRIQTQVRGNSMIRVDVGECVRIAKRDLRFMRNSTLHRPAKCQRCQSCLTMESVERIFQTREGPRKVEVIQSCGCYPLERKVKQAKSEWKKCTRSSSIKVFYQGTRFETRVDVGQCAGLCGNHTCQVAETKCHVVRGPNGKHCVNVTKSCTCAAACRRLSYKRAFREYVFDSDTNTARYQTRVVDMGRCSGQCPRLTRQQYCERIRRQFDFLCKLTVKPVQLTCRPHTVSRDVIQTSATTSKEIMIVKACICKQ